MNLACSCGRRFRNMGQEARHRHAFPALCKRPKLREFALLERRTVEREVYVLASSLEEAKAKARALEFSSDPCDEAQVTMSHRPVKS